MMSGSTAGDVDEMLCLVTAREMKNQGSVQCEPISWICPIMMWFKSRRVVMDWSLSPSFSIQYLALSVSESTILIFYKLSTLVQQMSVVRNRFIDPVSPTPDTVAFGSRKAKLCIRVIC